MKKRFLSAFLALAMMLTLLPSTALAAGDGEIHSGYETFYYRLTSENLAKILASEKKSAADVENIKEISIVFNDNYLGQGKEFKFDKLDPANSNDQWTRDRFTPIAKAARPDNIDCLRITLEGGETITLQETALTWSYEKVGGEYRYDLKLTNADEYCVVTFLYQKDANVHWSEYTSVVTSKGENLGEKMPDPPQWTAQHFVEWELNEPGSGETFDADTVVSGDTTVYARKVSAAGGGEYHVMNEENALFEEIVERYNQDKDEDSQITADAVTIKTIQVNGKKGVDGIVSESTNPDYFTNGWKSQDENDHAYYYI